MHAEEVDLAHLDLLLFDHGGDGDSGDGGDEFLVLVADADQPVGAVAGGRECPLEEVARVIEAVGVVVVLHVVVGEEGVKLRGGRGTSSRMPSWLTSMSSQ
jgi:hypothetical protein